eukprot:GFUD01080238.1.p1 GENE.GFUD01080238.1~~GFUD01080238.1.p1  ORF type:complete len:402 (+),score=142.36 GFUD01080238.1:74-1279(+)
MSVPPTPQTRYSLPPTPHQTRKPGYRCLPEIHASRLAVSGSLRPKLGLLLLLVVVLVSLCFILVPLLSKISFSSPKTRNIPPLPLFSLFEHLSVSSPSTILLSPDLILSSLAMVGSSLSSNCGELTRNSSSVRLAGRIFMERKRKARQSRLSRNCPGVEEEQVDFRTKQGSARVGDWLQESGVTDTLANTDIGHTDTGDSDTDNTVIATVATIKLHLTVPSAPQTTPGHWVSPTGSLLPVKFTVLTGQYKVASLPTYTTVLLDTFRDNLELYLLLPHTKSGQIGHITWDDFNLASFGTTHLEILLPPISLVSHVTLSPSLHSLGHLSPDTTFTQHTSLHLTPMTSSHTNTSQAAAGESHHQSPGSSSSSSTRLVFDHSFVLVVKEVDQDSVILMMRYSSPS